MGDVPYTADQEFVLQRQISTLPGDGRFVVHVGDIKAGATPCDESIYINVAEMLQQISMPVFIIPGDNEWNDCVDPVEGWRFWQKHYLRFDQNWQHKLPVFRQFELEENFSFVVDEVLFVGINLVGGRVHDADEWQRRHQQNIDWLKKNLSQFGGDVHSLVVFGHANPAAKHEDFFAPFVKEAKGFGKPILYIHGDGHKWIKDRPFDAQNILRVQVDQGGLAPPIRVTVKQNTVHPFLFDRRK